LQVNREKRQGERNDIEPFFAQDLISFRKKEDEPEEKTAEAAPTDDTDVVGEARSFDRGIGVGGEDDGRAPKRKAEKKKGRNTIQG